MTRAPAHFATYFNSSAHPDTSVHVGALSLFSGTATKQPLDLDQFVTGRITLDQVNDAFAAMHRQEGIRSVILFD